MSYKKPDLYTIEKALIESFPKSYVDQFVADVGNGLSPSKALANFIEAQKITNLDSSVILDLLRRAYPGIDIAAISWRIHDSGYPLSNQQDLTDSDFDSIIKEAVENPSEW